VRRQEVESLDWSAVKFDTERVIVPKEIAKDGEWRSITMRPNLKAWMETVPPENRNGVICDFRYNTDLVAARKKAKITDWPHNCLRHGFASYSLIAEEEPGRLQMELGHSTPKMLIQHYRVIGSPGDAKAWWQIKP
jgi:integrase